MCRRRKQITDHRNDSKSVQLLAPLSSSGPLVYTACRSLRSCVHVSEEVRVSSSSQTTSDRRQAVTHGCMARMKTKRAGQPSFGSRLARIFSTHRVLIALTTMLVAALLLLANRVQPRQYSGHSGRQNKDRSVRVAACVHAATIVSLFKFLTRPCAFRQTTLRRQS